MEPICDLVLLSWNHLEETRACLESLFATVRRSVRLILVDNGSEPSVRESLRKTQPQGAVTEVCFVPIERNIGFSGGMNRGIAASRTSLIALLSNDLRFGPGWLEEMMDLSRAHPDIGLINPQSNTFGNRPPAGVSLEDYARRLGALRGRFTEVGMCIGFCALTKREVLDRIGGFSEEVDKVFFEDEDLSMRVQRAGFRCVVASASYVFHAEHQTVKGMPDREALFLKNRLWCEEKWGRRIRIAWPRFLPVAPGSDELRRWLQRLVEWVRRRTHVYVYCPTPSGFSKDGLFRSVGLVPHADIHWRAIPSLAAPAAALGQILMRRKKPFDVIVAPHERWARVMSRWRWWHRAEVVLEGEEEKLSEQWKRRSRFRS